MQDSIVPHLKDLIHICLEQGDQDPNRTLKIIYALPNNPYFTSLGAKKGTEIYLFSSMVTVEEFLRVSGEI